LRILIAEDDRLSRRMLVRALGEMGHEVVAAADGLEAWEALERDDLRLVIADWMMPRLDGLQLVRKIRAAGFDRYVYVILLTSRAQKTDIIEGLAAGADDYVTKPFDRDELAFRLSAGERVVRLEEELAARNEQLQQLALHDALTGIPNRRSLDQTLTKLLAHARRFERPLSVIMLDLDHFKRYNDGLGHDAGDEALRRVARLLASSTREVDEVFRYGGEEFCCLLPETGSEGALGAAGRLRAAIEEEALPHPDNPPAGVITISAGIATFDGESEMEGVDLIKAADRALYAAKAAGRNRVACAPDLCVG
jgi:two-component system chemotaxis response regulator CheY